MSARPLALMGSIAVLLATGAVPSLSASAADGNGGISLPPGFRATVFADHVGHARQMVVGPDGTLYVNNWSGRYYSGSPDPKGAFLVALKDTKGGGTADKIDRFGPTAEEGTHGGTGIYLYNDKIYAEQDDKIVRYDLPKGANVPSGKPEVVVSGLPITGDHPMHPFVIDANGNLFVDLGSATNACQEKNRSLQSTGIKDCPELDTRGGVWRYDANKTDQKFSPAERYATGLRNGEGLAFDAKGRLFATQHGRDQLYENFPQFYNQKQGATLPAEELVQLTKGADFGWPTCYFDATQDKLVLAPEYGGDGGKKVGACADKTRPIAAFPAHIAPNALVIYQGDMFPKAYKGAALLAFHGSWNRAPSPQEGFDVVVQPLEAGKPSAKYEVLADGFAGAIKTPKQAVHRPTGLAVAPDGALYISDDIQGTIWRVTYSGDKAAALKSAPAGAGASSASAEAVPPEGTHPDAGAPENAAALKPPAGTTKEEIALGSRIFHGQAKQGTCATCHGSNAEGLPIGPALVKKDWVWAGDGSLQGIEAIITSGVPEPKKHPGMMPPKGGAPLDEKDVKALAAYIYALNHQS